MQEDFTGYLCTKMHEYAHNPDHIMDIPALSIKFMQ